jgi:RNA polymerase sigma-70 factor (ECF subfamily)
MSELAEYSDLELVEALLERDEDALAEIHRRHASSVADAARMILGRWPICDDVVADVFFSLWLKPQLFDPARGSLLSFLRIKARGRSIDLVRSETARRRREKADARSPQDPAHDIDSDLLSAEAVARMHCALETLPASERQPIDLAFFSGMSYREVAIHLNLPEGTVKGRIREALRHMKAVYESQLLLERQRDEALSVSTGRA